MCCSRGGFEALHGYSLASNEKFSGDLGPSFLQVPFYCTIVCPRVGSASKNQEKSGIPRGLPFPPTARLKAKWHMEGAHFQTTKEEGTLTTRNSY